jgi:hypothetical protein
MRFLVEFSAQERGNFLTEVVGEPLVRIGEEILSSCCR